jgi:hypothetical protein
MRPPGKRAAAIIGLAALTASGALADQPLAPPLFPADARPEPYQDRDRETEAACFLGWSQNFAVMTLIGKVPDEVLRDPALQRRITCTAIALCDLIDGKPNLMAALSAFSSEDYTDLCEGVEAYGPETIRQEPALLGGLVPHPDKARS